MTELRGDLDRRAVGADPVSWRLNANSIDAVVALDPHVSAEFLSAALAALRPGGRLIVVEREREPSRELVETLEEAGYTRILVEPALDGGPGVLMRGEKPHETADTLARIQVAAAQDDALADFSTYSGRYVHLLVRQTPNKPVWALRPGEAITWDAIALDGEPPVLLAFSSLPRAVGFMQPAVMSGRVVGVNKVAKFSREAAQSWTLPALLNPPVDLLDTRSVIYVSMDPETAEAPDE
jgi:hypothetical protein